MKYEWLVAFDRAMTWYFNTRRVHTSGPARKLWIDNENKLILFARGGRLYAFNLHPTRSLEGVFLDARLTGPGSYRVALSTDHWPWGGSDRIDPDYVYHTGETPQGFGIKIYLPCRTGVALEKVYS